MKNTQDDYLFTKDAIIGAVIPHAKAIQGWSNSR